LQKIVDDLSKLTLVEAADLAKMLKDKWGVRPKAKNANVGKCVHCLKDPVALTSDHMFPKAWYPDATPKNLEKWQILSCVDGNSRYSKIEGDLLNRVALALDTKHPASAGLVDAALRAMNPDAGRDEKDTAARAARAKTIPGEMFKGEQIPEDAIMPGLGERWGRPKAEQMAVQIPKTRFTDMTEKIVRGLVYREDGIFIEAPYKIEAYIVDDEGAKVCKEMLDKAGKAFRREPGLEIRPGSRGWRRTRWPLRDHLLATVQNVRSRFKIGSPGLGLTFLFR